jgi:hypothetical protein
VAQVRASRRSRSWSLRSDPGRAWTRQPCATRRRARRDRSPVARLHAGSAAVPDRRDGLDGERFARVRVGAVDPRRRRPQPRTGGRVERGDAAADPCGAARPRARAGRVRNGHRPLEGRISVGSQVGRDRASSARRTCNHLEARMTVTRAHWVIAATLLLLLLPVPVSLLDGPGTVAGTCGVSQTSAVRRTCDACDMSIAPREGQA